MDYPLEHDPKALQSMEVPLRADRWWSDMGEQAEDPDQGRCLGIRCNIWARAQRLREITHHLRGGGSHKIGWGALRWQEMVSTDEVRFGKLRELRYLPKTSSTSFMLATSQASTCPRCPRIVAALTSTPCSIPCTSHTCYDASRL